MERIDIAADGPLLQITRELEKLPDLDSRIAVLNLPGPNLCGKRAELVTMGDGTQRQSCEGCVTQHDRPRGEWLDELLVRGIISLFAERYGTVWTTNNGRGDPLHPLVRPLTLAKIDHAHSLDLGTYLFWAGNGQLEDRTLERIARAKTNVMLSLYGNRFIDAEFFEGKRYASGAGRMQDEAATVENFRRVIAALQPAPPVDGVTRVGMNYVVRKVDLARPERVLELKRVANAHGLYFVANVGFEPHADPGVQRELVALAGETNGGRSHSTMVRGHCRMGVGAMTIDYEGTLYTCPYLHPPGDGNLKTLSDELLDALVRRSMADRRYACVYRKTTPIRIT